MWRNWVVAPNSDFLIPISLQLNLKDHRYFKLGIMLDQIIKVLNVKGFQRRILLLLYDKNELSIFVNLLLNNWTNWTIHII